MIAIRTASMAVSKQSAGDWAASTGTGASPLRPYITWSKSACSVLVGMPVDGPARWMSHTISGSSVITPSPMVSAFNAIPGPEVVVTPRWPAKLAPRAAPTPAISSSAWKVVTPNRLCLLSSCSTSEAGVIGYAPRKIGNPAFCAPAIRP